MALTLLQLCRAFFGHGDSDDFHWEDWDFVSGSQTHDSSLVMTFLGKSGFLLEVQACPV